MKHAVGFLIRKHRLEQNRSQEALCQGICVVSYLSKIEQGQVQPSQEIVEQLFAALGIVYHFDATSLEHMQTVFVQYFEGMYFSTPVDGQRSEILEHREMLQHSSLYLNLLFFDWMEALKAHDTSKQELLYEEIKAFEDYFETGHQYLFHTLASATLTNKEEQWHHMQRASKWVLCASSEASKMQFCFVYGDYQTAILHANNAISLAVEEGSFITLVQACLCLGKTYARLGDVSLMKKHLQQASRLAANSTLAIEKEVQYTIGLHHLLLEQYKDAIIALERAQQLGWDAFLCAHALALAYEEVDAHQGIHYQEQALVFDKGMHLDLYERMAQVVTLRYQESYYYNESYAILLKEIYQIIHEEHRFDLKQLYAKLLQELYIFQRKYKDAFLLQQSIQDGQNQSKRTERPQH
ncbi:MAG: helix-turn-helix domain-containing protein [Erysipelotrichaceae bacterium]